MRVIVIGRGKMGTLLSESAAAHGHEVIAMADAANQDEVKPLDCDAVIDFPIRIIWNGYARMSGHGTVCSSAAPPG